MTAQTKPAISLVDLPEDWAPAVRQAMSTFEGCQMRANPHRPSIDFWSINRKQWMPLMLPSGATEFVSVEDRDAAMKMLDTPTRK